MTLHRAVVWDGSHLHIRHFDPELPAAGNARIRLRLAGICNTDLELMDGYQGFRGHLGHEFVGEVEDGPAAWAGRRVVGEINLTCGECHMCQRGEPTQCINRRALGISGGDVDGAFGDSFVLPVENLHAVPDNVPDEAAVFTEPLAAACRIPALHPMGPGDTVVLIGAGKLGMLCAQVIQQTGANLTVIVRREKQAALLATWGITAKSRDDVPNGRADYIIEASGQASGFGAAVEIVRPRGTIILKSTFNALTPADLTAVAVREIRIEGSRCGPFDTALALLLQGKVDVQSMIDGQYMLDDIERAMEHAAQRGTLKILLKP